MNTLFVIKCVISEHPVYLIVFLWLFTIFIFSYVIRILEKDNPLFEFINYYNSIWFVLVTLTSIGYGDYYPKTPLGKICNLLLFTSYIG